CTVREESERFADADAAFVALNAALAAGDPATTRAQVSSLLPDVELSPSTTSRAAVNTEQTLPSVTAAAQGSSMPESVFDATLGQTGDLGRVASRATAEPTPPPARPAPYPVVVLALMLAVVTAAGGLAIWWLAGDSERRAGADDSSADVIARVDTKSVEPDRSEPRSQDQAIDPPNAEANARAPRPSRKPPRRDPAPPPPPPNVDGPGGVEHEPDDGGTASHSGDNDKPVTSPLLPRVVPMATQLGNVGEDVEFRGWSRDGSRFAVAVTRADYSRDGDDREMFRLLEVHDALTGTMVESFVLRHEVGRVARATRKRVRARDEAGDVAQWRARKKTLDLLPAKRRRVPETAGVSVTAALRDTPTGTRAEVRDNRRGFSVRWFDIGTPAKAIAAETRGPRFELSVDKDGQRWPMLSGRVPYTVGEIVPRRALVEPGASDQPAATVRIDLHWSPDGQRVVIIVESAIEPRLASDRALDSRFYLRGAGPQIRVVDAGAGHGTARRVALDLEAKGHPIARVDIRQSEAVESTVQHRRGHTGAAELAEVLAAALGQPVGSARLSSGWASATIVLGQDMAPAP
ncbi:MAG: LytR C-terminal domain-containing protein, partial [Myxococcota bacterium]